MSTVEKQPASKTGKGSRVTVMKPKPASGKQSKAIIIRVLNGNTSSSVITSSPSSQFVTGLVDDILGAAAVLSRDADSGAVSYDSLKSVVDELMSVDEAKGQRMMTYFAFSTVSAKPVSINWGQVSKRMTELLNNKDSAVKKAKKFLDKLESIRARSEKKNALSVSVPETGKGQKRKTASKESGEDESTKRAKSPTPTNA